MMQSNQAKKQERAEAAARAAVRDLEEANRERKEMESKFLERQEDRSPGVIGSLFRTVQGTVEHAKEAVVGKSHETAVKTGETAEEAAEKAKQAKDTAAAKIGEYKDSSAEKAKQAKDTTVGKTKETVDSAAEKAEQAKDTTAAKMGEYKDYAAEKTKETAEKAKQAKDTTVEKAREAKDATMEKGGEYKDYTAEKAKEGKDTAVGKMTELKDRAVGFFTGKKEETKQVARETTASAKEKYEESKEEARRKMEELKIETERERDRAASERGGGGILGVLGGVKDAIKDKLTPSQASEVEKGGGVSYQCGEGEAKAVDKEGRPVVEKRVEETPAGATAARLKEADQLFGQTYNDVGEMGDEGVVRVRVDRSGKM